MSVPPDDAVSEDLTWPDEIARSQAPFFGIRTAALVANEARWVHRRVEQFELLDERRARRQISVDFTLPNLPAPPWPDSDEFWLVPVALLQRRILTSLDVRDAGGASMPVLTREQNSVIAFQLLASQALETLAEAFGEGVGIEDAVLTDLSDVAGARRSPSDHPAESERDERTAGAVASFRRAAAIAAGQGPPEHDSEANQRQALWRDSTMRGFITMLAERFVLLVPVSAPAGTRLIIKLSFEQALEVSPILAASAGPRRARDNLTRLWRGLAARAGSSFGVSPHALRAQTRAVFGPESYHVEIAAPSELLIEYARLEKTTTVTNLETGAQETEVACVAEDRPTERAHLYESLFTTADASPTPASSNEEATTVSAITVDFFMRSSFLRPALLIGLVTCGLLAAGLVLKGVGVSRSGDVTALIVVLPALFAAYLIPGEHRLVRRMFRGVRFLVFLLSLVSFVAAGSLTVRLSSSARISIWAALLAVAAASTGTIGAALRASTQRATRSPKSRVHSDNA